MLLRINSNIVLESDGSEIEALFIKDNTFPNPEYLSNEQNGRAWANRDVSEEIYTYRREGGSLVLPRGYARDFLRICEAHGITPTIIDERASAPCSYPEILKGIVLRGYQQRAVDSANKFYQGTIVSPTGSGKSLIGLEIIRQKGEKALVLVHRSDLGKQWASVIEERLGIVPGLIGDGSWEIGNEITIAMVQTLASRTEETRGLSGSFGLVIWDEIQHLPSETHFNVLGLLNAKYRYGLSATLNRRDGLEPIIYRTIGPTIATIEKEEVEKQGATVPAKVISIETGFTPESVNSWSEFLESIASSIGRNNLIIDLAKKSDGSTLILVDRVKHAEELSAMLKKIGIVHVLAHGQISKVDRCDVMDRIKSSQITVGTTGLLGEGIDVTSWGTLIMGSPISSEIKLMQAIGRCVRQSPGKQQATIYDLKDDCGFAGSSFKKRFDIYKKNKIWVDFSKTQKRAV